MKNLPFALSVLAVISAALFAVLYVRLGNSKRLLQTQLATANTRAAGLTAQLARAAEQNNALEKRLITLDSDLGTAKSRLTATEARNIQLGRELAQAKALVTAHEQTERNLGGEIAALKRDLPAAPAAAVSRETVAADQTTIAELERQLANAQHGAAAPAITGASTAVFASQPAPPVPPDPASATLSATVLSVGPKAPLSCSTAAQLRAPRQASSFRFSVEPMCSPRFSSVMFGPISLLPRCSPLPSMGPCIKAIPRYQPTKS